jgi:hypothetical protein
MATGAAFEPIDVTTLPSSAHLCLPVHGAHHPQVHRAAEHMSPVDAG